MTRTPKIHDVHGEGTEHWKYGDVFTVAPDRTVDNWRMVMDGDRLRLFRLVPFPNPESTWESLV